MIRTVDIEHETHSLDKEDALDAQSQDRKSRKRTFLSLCGNKDEADFFASYFAHISLFWDP